MRLSGNARPGCPLVFACDEGYAMPLATTLRSIAETNRSGWPIEVYVLSHGFSKNTKRKILDSLPEGSFLVRWIRVDLTQFAGFSTLRHISSVTYARLLIPNILPESVHRALYLDADILVLDDLAPILEFDVEDAVLGAVVDERLDKHIKMGNLSVAGLPLPRVRDYFNAGVLLMDLTKWRTQRIAEKAFAYLERCPHSVYSDQDALNIACDGLWKQLDHRWNFYQIDLDKPISDLGVDEWPGIIHFHGCFKPWDARALNANAEFYNAFRSRTLFASTRGERLMYVPIVLWSRLKTILRRSRFTKHLWSGLRLLRSPEGRGRAGRPAA